MQSSYSLDGHLQRGGGRYVRETHVDSAGASHSFEYLAPAGWGDAEYSAVMAQRAVDLAQRLAEDEARRLLEQS